MSCRWVQAVIYVSLHFYFLQLVANKIVEFGRCSNVRDDPTFSHNLGLGWSNEIEPEDWGFSLLPFQNASVTNSRVCFCLLFQLLLLVLFSRICVTTVVLKGALYSTVNRSLCDFSINSKSLTFVEPFHWKDLRELKQKWVSGLFFCFTFLFEWVFALKVCRRSNALLNQQTHCRQRDIACVFRLCFEPCWYFTAALVLKWRLALDNL